MATAARFPVLSSWDTDGTKHLNNMPSHQSRPLETKTTVAVVANALAPYRIPLLNRIARLPEVRIRALLGEESERFRQWNVTLAGSEFEWEVFPSLVVPLRTKLADQTGLFFSPRLWKHLMQVRYDLVVAFGWTMPNSIMAWMIRRAQRRPIVLWDTSIPHPSGTLKNMMMPGVRRYFRAFDGYLASSTLCADYMVWNGASRDRVVLLPQAIDNEFFGARAESATAERETLKRDLDLAGRRVVLYVGQFTERKGMLPLLDAFRTVAASNPNAALLMVGNGPLKQELMRRRDAFGLNDRIVIIDFVQKPELPRYYAAADVFVLPSYYDTYGVVVNEAMACGLPIVTSDHVGAAHDLVQEGVNGMIVPAGDANALAGALERLLQDEPLCRAMGKRSLQIIAGWTVEVAAQNFAKCLAMCVPGRGSLPANQTKTALVD